MRCKRFWAVALSFVLVVGAIPITARANEEYSIIHQPNSGEPYVELDYEADVTYQWYEMEESKSYITDEDVSGTMAATYDVETKSWTAIEVEGEHSYFMMSVSAGDIFCMDIMSGDAGSVRVQYNGDPTYAPTVEQTATTQYEITMNGNGTHLFYSENAATIQVYEKQFVLGEALVGENAARLTNPELGTYYCCEITTPSGELTSEVFQYGYAITTQPTGNELTVGLNDATGATYQWYGYEAEQKITNQDTALIDVDGYPVSYSVEDGWSGCMMDTVARYFTLMAQTGETFLIEINSSEWIEPANIYMTDGSAIYHSSYENGRYSMTVSSGTYYLCIDGVDTDTTVSVYRDKEILTPIQGQISATFTGSTTGDHVCIVTFADGTMERADVVCVPHWKNGYCIVCWEAHDCDLDMIGKDDRCRICGRIGGAALIHNGQKTTYVTVEDAIEAAEDGDTIRLLDDFFVTHTVEIDKAITFDVNGHVVETPSSPNIVFNAPVILKDSVGTGAFEYVDIEFKALSKIENVKIEGYIVFDAEGYTAEDYLAEHCFFYDYDPWEGIISDEILDVAGATRLENVVVKECVHSWGIYTSDNNATCTADGTKTAVCANDCGKKNTITDTGSKKAHVDANNDGKCDIGGESLIVKVTGVTLNKTSATKYLGEILQLSAKVAPSNAKNKTVTYTTSNSKLATVNKNGLVTINKTGKTGKVVITATTADGRKTAKCTITVKAKATYKIAFKGNGATDGKMSTLTGRKYGVSYKLTANAFKRDGYKFTGWNTKKNGSGKTYKNKASVKNLTTQNGKTVNLYAQWKKIKYTITYELNGGKNNKSNKKFYYVTTSTFKLKEATRKGYVFKGWYSNKKCTKKVTQIKKGSTGNIKLYAKWVKIK